MLRWTVPAALLLVEYLNPLRSWSTFRPTGLRSGSSTPYGSPLRVILGSFAAGWMLRRGAPARPVLEPLPKWRPWPAAALQPVAFALTAALAYAILRPGAPPPSTSAVVGVLALAAATGAIALSIFAPPSWFATVLFRSWAHPLLAVAVGVLAWRAAAGAEELWGVLSETTLRGAAALLRLLTAGVSVGPEPDVIEVGDFGVVVAPICSGADGLGLVVLFQATWIALARERLLVKRSLLLIPLGMALAFGANMARIATLLWVGGSGTWELAAGGLHSKLGSILFIGIALGTSRWRSGFRGSGARAGRATPRRAPCPPAAAAYVAPLLAALVTALVTSIWSDGALDRWYVTRVLAARGRCSWLVRRDLPRPSISPSWFPVVAAGHLCRLDRSCPGGAAAGTPRPGALQGLGRAERWGWIVSAAPVPAWSSRWWRSWRSAGSSSAGLSPPSSRAFRRAPRPGRPLPLLRSRSGRSTATGSSAPWAGWCSPSSWFERGRLRRRNPRPRPHRRGHHGGGTGVRCDRDLWA